jgi:hypothetical protein
MLVGAPVPIPIRSGEGFRQDMRYPTKEPAVPTRRW